MACFLSSLASLRLLILLLLFISGNIYPNPGLIFPCSVCAGNVTWRGRSVQCCTCSKWVQFRCSLLSHSKFRTLGSSHSWTFPLCCVPTCNTVISSSDSSGLYTSTDQSGPLCQCCTPAPSSPSNLLSPFRPFCIFSLCPLTTVSCSWLPFYASCFLFLP